jgi:hypothetical protein
MRHATPLLLLTLLLAVLAVPCHALELEGGPVIGLWPDSIADIGARLGVHVWNWSEKVPLVGGCKQFFDGLYVNGKPAGGLSVSLRKAAEDDGTRFGAAFWKDTETERIVDWTLYGAYGVKLDLGFLK